MKIQVDDHMTATRIHTGTLTQSTGGPYETWKVHPHGLPMEPIAQVQVFKVMGASSNRGPHEGTWCYWGSTISKRTRALGAKLADLRNDAVADST